MNRSHGKEEADSPCNNHKNNKVLNKRMKIDPYSSLSYNPAQRIETI